MAVCKELAVNEEYLTCNICLELYDKPRTLPCLHSFCHDCLVGYAGKCLNKTGTSNFYCPICRARTQLERILGGNVEKWVKSLPLNFTLVSILSSDNNKMSESSYRSKCDQCLRDSTEVQAVVYCYECSEKLCEKCQEIHKKVKYLSNHRLCDIENKQEDIAKLELLKSLTKCPEHISEEVRYICKDHDQLCCNECAIVSHRKCNYMVSLAKDQIEIQKSTDETGDHLKELIIYLDKLAAHEVTYQSTIGVYKRELTDKLKCIKKRIDEAFQAMSNKVTNEFDKNSSIKVKESEMHKEQIELLKSEVHHSLAKMETAKEFGQPIHMFVMRRSLIDEIEKHEKQMRCLFEKSSAQIVQADEQAVCKEVIQKVAVCLRNETKSCRTFIPQWPAKFSSMSDKETRSLAQDHFIPQWPAKFSSMSVKETSSLAQDHTCKNEKEFEQEDVESAEQDIFEENISENYDTEDSEFHDDGMGFFVQVRYRNKTTKRKEAKGRKLSKKDKM